MPGDTSPSKVRAHAARSAADALLRTLGGSRVFVRVPAPVEDSTNAGELGIATAPVSDILLTPVVLRNLPGAPPARIELLVSANTLLRCCGIEDAPDAETFFQRALGVILRAKLARIESMTFEEFAGIPYFYRIVVTG